MEESSSFSLGLTREIEVIAGYIAKARASEEGGSKDGPNEPIFKPRNQEKKRKAVIINSTSSESENDGGSDENDNNDGEDENELFSPSPHV